MELTGWQFQHHPKSIQREIDKLEAGTKAELLVLRMSKVRDALAKGPKWGKPFDVLEFERNSQRLVAALQISYGDLKVDDKKNSVKAHFVNLGVAESDSGLGVIGRYEPIAAIFFDPKMDEVNSRILRNWPTYYHPTILTFENGDTRAQRLVAPHQEEYMQIFETFEKGALGGEVS